MATRYRNRRTGRFASKRAWNRSHGKKGKYKREFWEPKPKAGIVELENVEEWLDAYSDADDFESEEYMGGIDYKGKR
jgi:hypothetical protein